MTTATIFSTIQCVPPDAYVVIRFTRWFLGIEGDIGIQIRWSQLNLGRTIKL